MNCLQKERSEIERRSKKSTEENDYKKVSEYRSYRDVKLDSRPEIKVFHMLFERCHTNTRKRSIKQHIQYFNFQSKIQLDHPVEDADT